MLLTGYQETILLWLDERGVCGEHPDVCETFAWIDEQDVIQGALAFHHYNERSMFCDIALEGGRFPRKLLFAALWYAFEQLGVLRLTFFVAPSNLKSIALVEKLGAYRGATLEDGCSEGEVYIYYLLPEKCPIWSKLHGKEKVRTAGA